MWWMRYYAVKMDSELDKRWKGKCSIQLTCQEVGATNERTGSFYVHARDESMT
jgi:hypothetical protein